MIHMLRAYAKGSYAKGFMEKLDNTHERTDSGLITTERNPKKE